MMSYRTRQLILKFVKKNLLSWRNNEVLALTLVNYSQSFMYHKMKFSSQLALFICGLHTFSFTNTFLNYFDCKKKKLHGHHLGFQRHNLIHILFFFFQVREFTWQIWCFLWSLYEDILGRLNNFKFCDQNIVNRFIK